MIQITNKHECCGCGACQNICPQNCIKMCVDAEGFSYPQVDLNKCIKCGKCKAVCPLCHVPSVLTPPPHAFAAQSINQQIREKSASGGIFYEIAKNIIEHKGVACGATYDINGMVRHKIVDKVNQLEALQGSKYVQSDLNNCFQQINNLLAKQVKVLFVGTPCQVAALKNYTKDNADNLVLVDLVCFGVPSPLIYSMWRSFLEKKYKKKIASVNFRDKSYGYAAPNVKILFADGKAIEQTYPVKSYMKLFMSELNVRPSCYKCQFKGVSRCSDITLGDCWSIKKFESSMDDNIGTTGVYIHTERGFAILEDIKSSLTFREINLNKAVSADGKKRLFCAQEPNNREEFYTDIPNGYEKLIYKWAPETYREKLITFSKRALKKAPFFKSLLHWYKHR